MPTAGSVRRRTGTFKARRGEEMACRWEKFDPKVAAMLRENLEDCLSVLEMPEHHRKRLASTNLLENIIKRSKKRTKVVGVFPNRASCDGIYRQCVALLKIR